MGRTSREEGAAGLHHKREVANMRSEYDHGRGGGRKDDVSEISSRYSHSSSEKEYRARRTRSTMSEASYHTVSTEHSVDYFTPVPSKEQPSRNQQHSGKEPPPVKRADTAPQMKRPVSVHQHQETRHQRELPRPEIQEQQHRFFDDRPQLESPAASVKSFTSTLADEADFEEPPPAISVPYNPERVSESSNVIAATPSDFSQLFPSSRTLLIHHDDTTEDGNENLRVDTEVSIDGSFFDMTLFHLRLQDLRNREFSLRRYCRDSGREVCHSTRKQQKPPADKRPGFTRSLSNALTNMRMPSGQKTPSLSRSDSGYDSVKSGGSIDEQWTQASAPVTKPQESPLTDTIRLEFSNYAQAGVKRVSAKGNKRYEFEYWNVQYFWRRLVQRDSGSKTVSYYLTKVGSDEKLAHITPVPLSACELDAEREKGGWIPPCRMRIVDKGILNAQKDLADTVVASGLMALVDDNIRTRLESREGERSVFFPSRSVQYIGPKRLISEMFGKKDGGSSRPGSRPSSSRQTSSRPSTAAGSDCNGSGMASAPAPVRRAT